jgi:hypothetical protein
MSIKRTRKSRDESKESLDLGIFDGLSRNEIFNLQNKNNILTAFDPKCIRQKSNWSKASKYYQLDSGIFKPDRLSSVIPEYSPKLDTLLHKIKQLDRKDQAKFGHTFKHFIFSDLKSGVYGAKLIASALISNGWTLGYKAELKKPIKEEEQEDEDEDEGEGKKKKIWGPIEMLPDSELSKTKGDNFYLLSSTSVYDKAISVKMKKEILARFNARPENIYGENTRIIVMDSGFKEGIDLFDIKYIHIFEPSINPADQKQVIGRGTRTCGQKGLPFDPKRGWPLYVFVYDLEIPEPLQKTLLASSSAFELYKKALKLDTRLLNFNYDIERVLITGSVDYELNKPVHNFSLGQPDDETDLSLSTSSPSTSSLSTSSPTMSAISKGSMTDSKPEFKGGAKRHIRYDSEGNARSTMGYDEMRDYIHAYYRQFTWEKVKMENLCGGSDLKGGSSIKKGGATVLKYTASQDFIRHFFSPNAPVKGLLMNWSVGTGKTAAAIAAASRNFEAADYTILWVTRTTLKNDIWKNMFNQVANESIRDRIQNGFSMPPDLKNQMKLLGKSWRIRPISYKQFSNLVLKQNDYYERLVKENGTEDPLRKTLLIIDEAHKLYGGGDLSSIERPDMPALHKALMHSYAVSGENSCRLLLMTATPITENPMELVQLINLCKLPEEQMPHTFETFSSEYLNQDGQFTERGEHRFLNDIAGHISYLNREKDARQFAQPIIQKIDCPIVSAKNMEIVKQYDKVLLKTELSGPIEENKARLLKENDRLNGELKEMGRERFEYLKEICDEVEVPTKYCKKIVNKNIRDCLKEIKEYIKSIREETKHLRKEIQSANKFKTDEVKKIADKIAKNPEAFESYKNSAYFTLRNKCSFRITTIKDLRDHFDEYPEVKALNETIQKQEDAIEMLKNQLSVIKDSYRLKVRELRDFIKTGNLSELERSAIYRTLRDLQASHKKTMKITRKETRHDIVAAEELIKKVEGEKKKVYAKLKKTLKKVSSLKKKDDMKEKKEEIKMRKLARKQGELVDEIQDPQIKEIANKYEGKIDEELMGIGLVLAEEIEEKEREREEKLQAKAAAKEALKLAKAAAKTAAREEKAKEKAAKKTRKSPVKALEKKMKVAEKKVKSTEKAVEKVETQIKTKKKNQVKMDVTSKIALIKALVNKK